MATIDAERGPAPDSTTIGMVARLGWISIGSLLLTLFFLSPHLQLMGSLSPDSFVWARAQTFLLQCEAPFRTDIETAMRFRILPPLLARALGLPGLTPLIIPWVGVGLLIFYVVWILHTATRHAVAMWLGAILISTTSAILVPLHWLGINDAWVWLALLLITFSPNRTLLLIATLLAPWVDERFLIGLPLAAVVRHGLGKPTNLQTVMWPLVGLLPYVIIRVAWAGIPFTGAAEHGFLQHHLSSLPQRIRFAPLAWWMGLRLAWAPVLFLLVTQTPRQRWTLMVVATATLAISTLLAWDTSRSTAILLPMVLAGSISLWNHHAAWIHKHAKVIAAGALLLPTAHVVGHKLDPVEPLLLELARWMVSG